jgi:geranylgeranyl pyrophosphate synthase
MDTPSGTTARSLDLSWGAELDDALERELHALWRGVAPSADADTLAAALREAVDGGKRVRPRLLAGVHDALGGRQPHAVLAAAAAVELLHTAFVIHDDLIDGDDLRRSRPSVLGRFRAEAPGGPADRGAYATAGAVLTGDLALAAAVLAFATLPVPEAGRAQVMALVAPALATSATGELADVRLALDRDRCPDEAAVLDLAARKTAAYSFELPMQVGAVLAGADEATVATVGRAARSLGIAFQVHDDLAGMFEDATTTGKDPLSDLREGKLTLLIAHACTTSAWPAVARHWGDPRVTVQDLHAVRRALSEAGSRSHAQSVAAAHLGTGMELAREAGLDTLATGWLATLMTRQAEEAA